MSDELILHHYDLSPFSEKIRLAMGLKKLNWRSVITDVMPPRPFLEPLTGGYRRTPVLQVGADIYCDTHLILRTLDRLRPDSPGLFSNSTTQPLCWWWDKVTFVPAVAVWASFHGDKLSKEFVEDRKKFAPALELTKESSGEKASLNIQRINSHLVWLTDILADGRLFLQGEPSAFDVTAYHTLWFIKRNCGNDAENLLPELYKPGLLLSWYERVAAFGHGTSESMTSEQAFDVAKQAEPIEPNYITNNVTDGWTIGERLRVTPDDTGCVPVEGTLVAADNHEIVLRLSDKKAGNINVHFPRAGFDVVRA
jgi:glutathione S-transferase